MERHVQHARSPDGTRIAYWTVGSGPPLLYLAGGPWNHIEIWDVPECQRWYERLAHARTLVRYEVRGTGLSDRDATDFSLDAFVRDLGAVADELGLAQFDLFAAGDAGPVAVAYGARHPDRVARSVMWCAWSRGSDFETSPRIQAWRGLIDDDWDLMVETCAHLAFGWDAGAIGRQAADAFRASITRETAQAVLEATVGGFDVTASMSRFKAPTLVIHRNNISWLPVEVAHRLAAAIPHSHLAIIDGHSSAPYLGNTEALVTAIEQFLGGAEPSDVALQLERAPATTLDGQPASPQSQRTNGAVEILPLLLDGDGIRHYYPDGSPSWQVTLDPSKHPGDVASRALEQLGRRPVAVHSTSWRVHDDRLVLTYAAVLREPIDRARGFRSASVTPKDLARGTATDAPASVQVGQVVEHALRHLAWLVRDDEPIRTALGPAWEAALAGYSPEPFSAFDVSGQRPEEDAGLACTVFSSTLSRFVQQEC